MLTSNFKSKTASLTAQGRKSSRCVYLTPHEKHLFSKTFLQPHKEAKIEKNNPKILTAT